MGSEPGWRFATPEQERRWSAHPALRAHARQVAALLAAGGDAPEQARRRLAGDPWWGVLLAVGPGVAQTFAPELVAREVRTPLCCAICGHPLHRSAADLRLPLGGAPRLVRGLPHVAACSCGYAQPIVDGPWAAALAAHFAAHPGAAAVEAAEPELLAAVSRAAGGGA